MIGLNAYRIVVEVDVDKKAVIHDVDIVGLGDTVVKESKKRVKSALKNSGFPFPRGRITINLAPSDIKKEGSYLDLPMAVGILKASEVIQRDISNYLFFGELGLDGSVRKIRGVLPALLRLSEESEKPAVILPASNEAEASIIQNIEAYTVRSLSELVAFLNGSAQKYPIVHKEPEFKHSIVEDFSDIRGQEFAKRAAEVAAAGAHNLLLKGSPGCGKTMLARRIPGILPKMSLEEAIETTKIYSVASLLDGKGLVAERPFRSPHHTASTTAIIGGGTDARPGEISLAHNGVLFLDELPEFRRDVLEALRQPLEDGQVTISRARLTVTYPARFMLVAAQNPCPCGWYGDKSHECTCSWNDIKRYNRKISGPIEDRIDIFVDMPRLEFSEYSDRRKGESSTTIRGRVEKARQKQYFRLKPLGKYFNSQLNHREIEELVVLDSTGVKLLESAVEKLKLTGRSVDRILKVSLTIADLEGSERILPRHIAEAIQYRKRDVNF
ncbi:YifB family Mg chelatase-like AAA ATPase [Kosmotoga pacifica]|uniref:Magnesium chelatase n=1 Tax=Kosmotoga pacifica TaxID=1330330 RepID=A0A0G2ZHR7_9BACT|nr:magnesium chelatase [Kosmotoga pacifica]